ncbi:MAG: VOC family protein [bacterium]|nr:VOC family protein [bacterium]
MAMALKPQLTHVAIFIWDMPKMRQFYTDVFGLTVTDEGRHTATPGRSISTTHDLDIRQLALALSTLMTSHAMPDRSQVALNVSTSQRL